MAVMYVYFKRSKPMSVVDCNSTSAADSGTKFLEIYAKIRNALQCWVYLIPKQFKIKNIRPDICLAERVSRYRCTGRFLSLSTQWSCTESLRTQWRCWPLTLGRYERCSKTLEPYERCSWYFGISMLYMHYTCLSPYHCYC